MGERGQKGREIPNWIEWQGRYAEEREHRDEGGGRIESKEAQQRQTVRRQSRIRKKKKIESDKKMGEYWLGTAFSGYGIAVINIMALIFSCGTVAKCKTNSSIQQDYQFNCYDSLL